MNFIALTDSIDGFQVRFARAQRFVLALCDITLTFMQVFWLLCQLSFLLGRLARQRWEGGERERFLCVVLPIAIALINAGLFALKLFALVRQQAPVWVARYEQGCLHVSATLTVIGGVLMRGLDHAFCLA